MEPVDFKREAAVRIASQGEPPLLLRSSFLSSGENTPPGAPRRYGKAQGHLFQGRFKSLIVEPGKHGADLVD
jgi:hypothetical protein